ncbi:hypothetical protein OJAV_G00233260 [Oryzias javanicus]|uniref:Uncharacterized protein n=1 Tax=Oryzias javanicus TaxID=123683 RepID=A0A437C138_ORYJA|nr:hypothetical protein OJAV_G00233260 [Oryzias javanicus]
MPGKGKYYFGTLLLQPGRSAIISVFWRGVLQLNVSAFLHMLNRSKVNIYNTCTYSVYVPILFSSSESLPHSHKGHQKIGRPPFLQYPLGVQMIPRKNIANFHNLSTTHTGRTTWLMRSSRGKKT